MLSHLYPPAFYPAAIWTLTSYQVCKKLYGSFKCLNLIFVCPITALSTCALGFEKQPSAILESLALLLTGKLWRRPHNWSISEPGNEIMIEHPAVTGYVTTVTASDSTTHSASTCCRQFANKSENPALYLSDVKKCMAFIWAGLNRRKK